MKLNWSLRTKLVALSVFSSLVLSAAGVGCLYYLGHHSKEAMVTNFDTLADAISHEIAAQFYERYGDVQAFALNSNVVSMNGPKMQTSLDQYVGLYGIYDLILVVDKNGNYISSNTKDFSGKSVDSAKLAGQNYKNEAWFKAVVEGRTTDDKTKGLAGTYVDDWTKDHLQSLAFGEDRLGMGFASAVKDEKGNVIGVVMNRAGSRFIESEVQTRYDSLKALGYNSVEISVFNKENQKFVDYYPQGNGGKEDFIHDWGVLLKKNFAEGDSGTSKHLKARTDGHDIFPHSVRGVMQVAGLMPVEDKVKMVDSVGWYAMIRVDADEVFADVNRAQTYAFIILGIFTLAFAALSMLVASAISKRLSGVSEQLFVASRDSRDAANKIASQSTELSEAATEQAAALQETMAAVDEIEATATKNADSAVTSLSLSNKARDAAQSGKRNADNMLTAVGEILKSNEEMGVQIHDSNRQIGEIVRMIQEIGNKTKVINEIVFQTKLLSFNASVEAARAGEAGKGFAVVAEEVGNLAQMSGKAAQEITTMLDESTMKVERIVSESTSKMDEMMRVGKEKVTYGTRTAEECKQSLDVILGNVNHLDKSINEIVTASKEQTHGIKEIAKTMGQLNVVTQQNAVVAQQSSAAAEQLNSQAQDLNSSVNELAEVIQGEGADAAEVSHQAKHAEKSARSGQLIRMEKRKKASAPKQEHRESAPSVTAKAVSGDATPSSDDPRFEDV